MCFNILTFLIAAYMHCFSTVMLCTALLNLLLCYGTYGALEVVVILFIYLFMYLFIYYENRKSVHKKEKIKLKVKQVKTNTNTKPKIHTMCQ